MVRACKILRLLGHLFYCVTRQCNKMFYLADMSYLLVMSGESEVIIHREKVDGFILMGSVVGILGDDGSRLAEGKIVGIGEIQIGVLGLPWSEHRRWFHTYIYCSAR